MSRVFHCPGSCALERVCPSTDTPDSLAGTQGHAALAGEDVELDGRLELTVEECERITANITRETGFETVDPKKERRLWWIDVVKNNKDDHSPHEVFSGQFDRLYLHRNKDLTNRALVIDFKTLYGDHDPAVSNWQLRTLALLVANTYEVSDVTVALVQPWVKGQFTLAHYGAKELAEAREAILAAVAASDAPNAPRRPGNHCQFCKGLAICPEAQARAESVVLLATAPKPLAERHPDELGNMLGWISFAEKAIEKRKSEIKALLFADPNSVTGWRMAPGNERRVVPNNAELFFALKDEIHLEMGEFLAACKVTLGTLSKIHKEKTRTKGKAQTEAFDALIAPHVKLVQNAPSLEKI